MRGLAIGFTVMSTSKNDLFGAKGKTAPDYASGGDTDSTREQLEISARIKIRRTLIGHAYWLIATATCDRPSRNRGLIRFA